MKVDEAFGKVIGRQPSQAERERLYRVRDALGLSDNDAFWYIVMILEHYDALYREYPAIIAKHAEETVENARRAFAMAAEAESAKAQRILAQRVAETSVAIARQLAEKPIGIHRVTAMLAAVVVFGTICMTAGVELAGGKPAWWTTARDGPGPQIVGLVLGAPVGWIAFALLLPVALYGARQGWSMAHELDMDGARRAIGWSLIAVCVVAAVVSAVLLAKTLG